MKLPWLIIAILGIIAMIFTIISLATTAWLVSGLTTLGLWKLCVNSFCVNLSGGLCCICKRSEKIVKLVCEGNAVVIVLNSCAPKITQILIF